MEISLSLTPIGLGVIGFAWISMTVRRTGTESKTDVDLDALERNAPHQRLLNIIRLAD